MFHCWRTQSGQFYIFPPNFIKFDPILSENTVAIRIQLLNATCTSLQTSHQYHWRQRLRRCRQINFIIRNCFQISLNILLKTKLFRKKYVVFCWHHGLPAAITLRLKGKAFRHSAILRHCTTHYFFLGSVFEFLKRVEKF